MESFNKKKSPGPDGLKPLVFSYFPPNLIEHLNTLYKASIALSFTPTLWKQTKVVFIPKIGKDDYSVPKAFRPISLSNYLLKTLEKLCCWRAESFLDSNTIHSKQHGFRTDRSTETAISTMTSYIKSLILNKKHCVAVFLDISAAFDSIKPDYIKSRMLEHNIDQDLCDWYYNYILQRILFFGYWRWKFPESQHCIGFPPGRRLQCPFLDNSLRPRHTYYKQI